MKLVDLVSITRDPEQTIVVKERGTRITVFAGSAAVLLDCDDVADYEVRGLEVVSRRLLLWIDAEI